MKYLLKKRHFSLVLLVLLLLVVVFFTCAKRSENADGAGAGARGLGVDGDTVVSTYIRTWRLEAEDQREESPHWDAGMVKAEYLTDLIIAFALINSDDKHTIYISEERFSFKNLWNEVAALKSTHPNLRVNISIGGYTGSAHFSDMVKDENIRAQFVAGVIDWLDRHNLDGVDIDWEYPVGPPWGVRVFADAQNYLALLRDLRDAMDTLGAKTGKYYSLSTAVPSSSWFAAAINVKEVANIVDALKLMAYDYYGGWSPTTGHNSNIYRNPNDSSNGGSTDQGLRSYLTAFVPPNKIQMGVAFYGRAFAGVQPGPNGDGLYQKYTSIPFSNGYLTWAQIKELLEPDSGFTRYWDDVAKAPYLYNGDIWITYTDQQQIEELVKFSKEKGLGGFFSWEYGTDINGDLLKALFENAQ